MFQSRLISNRHVDGVSYNAVPLPTAVLLGHTATLHCSFSDLSADDVVTWVMHPGRAIAYGRRVDPTYRRYQVVGDEKKGEFHLLIQDAHLEDGGAYTCYIFGLTPKEAKLTVVVPVPQPPTLRGAEIPGKAGQQMELSCTSSGGHPLPQLTWYNGTKAVTGQQVIQKESEGRVELDLILRRLTKWDNGMNLTCRASQPFPEITSAQDSWTILQVHYPPSVAVPIPSVRVVEGETADLTCLVNSNPPATIRWTRPSRSAFLNGNIGQKSFRIASTSRQDAGVYQCTADNGVHPIGVGTVTLDVLYPPLINPSWYDKVLALQDDNDFSLNCLVEGNPKPKVTWRRKNTKLYWQNPLQFNRVRYDVEGIYQCVGTSDGFPQTIKDVFVDVVGKPYMDGDGDTAMLSADTGETVRLGCTVAADPLPSRINWIWRNNYGLETEIDNADFRIVTTKRNQEMTSSLTIQNVAVKDSGSYICETTNMFGSAKRDMHLEVKDSIPNLVIKTSIAAGVVLVATAAVILIVIAKKKGWICKPQLDDSFNLSVTRPMPPVPKYVYKTGTIDSGVEDLQELQEMYCTLKPRPPPRMEKKWDSAGGVSYNAVPLPTAVLLGHTTTLHCSFHDLSPDDAVTWVRSPGSTITYGRRVDPNYPRYQPPTLIGAELPGKAGQQLELSCTSSGGHPPPQLTWYNGTEAFTGQRANQKERDGRVELNLILRRLTKWDNGMNLTCRASQPFPEITLAQDSWTVLQVHYPPSVSITSSSVRVVEGVTAELTCLVESNPPATISWTRPSRPTLLNGNTVQKIFRISRTSRQDAGIYQCTADNGVQPVAVGTVTLEVMYPPFINPSMDDKVTALQDDDDFSLNCLVEGNPKPKVTWRRKGTKLYWKNPLRFNRVRYDVEGTYQCVGTSDGFREQTKDVFVDVVGKPYMEGDSETAMLSADSGETVRLGCTVAADPLPSRINWIWRNNYGQETELDNADFDIITTRRNQEMTSSLTIPNVAVKDSGNYICETTNMFGSAKRDMHLEVKESFDLSAPRPMPPVPKYVYKTGTIDSGVEDLQEIQEMYGTLKPRPPPRVEKKWESVGLSYSVNGVSYNAVPLPTAVLLGHTATLHCSFNDLSADDVVVGDEKKGEFHLLIQDAHLEDGGAYTCNIFGDLTPKEAKLTVVVPVPQPPTLRGAEVPGKAGQQLELSCTSSGGHPPPQLTWYNGTKAVTGQHVIQKETEGHVELDLILRRLTKWDNDPPSVTVPIPSVRVVEGVTADLTCLVESNPAATIRWTRPDRPAVLNGNIGQKIFRIPSTSHQDAGVYQCTADNGVPPLAVGTVTLEVLYPPLIIPSMDDNVTALQDDDDFSLNCLVEGNPKPKVTWRRKGTKLYWKNPLRFNRVRYDVEGTYQCVGTSDGFRQQTKDVFVDVVGKPYMEGDSDTAMLSANSGETVRLGCTVAADPLPSRINWIWRNNYGQETELNNADFHIVTTRRNQEMTSSLTIPNVAVQDSGSYICETTNMFGSAKRDMHLEVKASTPNLVIITSIAAGVVLVATVAVILIVIAKKKGWICKRQLDDSFDLSAPRPMPPVPKYVYKTGTIDSGVEDLQELQEMYGTLKPRPPPRMEKKWESVVGDEKKGEFHLLIQDAHLEDGGAYTCNIFGLTPKEAKLTVVVPVPQPPTLRGAEIPGKAGKQMELSCTSSGGHPSPQLTWYNGTKAVTGQHVIQKESEGRVELDLILRRLTKWDNGMNLTCRASQPFPEITSAQDSWTILQVHYPPSVAVPIPSVRVVEGETADLTCLVNSNPPATIRWTRPSRSWQWPLLGNIGQKIFRIPRTSRQDAGVYQCTADNGVSPVAVGTVTLEVLYPPLINPSMYDKVTALQDDGDFSLNCLVEGNPKPKVTWRRKNTKLYWKNPLRFNRVRYDVEGTYQCVGTSDGFPQTTKDVFVDVLGKPYMDGEGDTAMLSVDTGETVRLGCTVAADPLPSRINWIWRNNYGQETDLDNADFDIVTSRRNQEMTSTLTIENVAVNDSGSYICETTNMFGSAKRDMHLEVKDSFDLSASRPMHLYNTGTIDSGVEGLQELQEMYGTLKPRPPPRMEKWESVGLSYSAWAVSYNEVPEPTAVLLGHTATLRCSFHERSPEDVVTWNGPPDMTAITYGRRVDPNYPRHKIAGDVQNEEFYLKIQDASVEDAGTYKCKVFGLSPREAKLTVIGAEVPSKAGQQLEVSCTSSGGHPLPQLTWYNGTEAFTEQYVRRQEKGDRVEADLILRRLTKWDNGMNLTCRARQPFPEITSAQESWKILQVNYPPSISVPTTSVQAKEGDPAILSCLVDSYPFASITWTKHGLSVPNNDMGTGTYRIPRASRQDAGVYQCTADNGLFPIAVGTVSLDVLCKYQRPFYPPRIDPSMEKKVTVLQGNDEFSLECLAEGNPEPRVKWWRKDTNLYWENPLRFHRVHYDIEGTYQCVAISNGFPQSTKDIHIDVIGKPHLDGHGNSAMMNAAVGETVRLPCAVFADPLPSNVEWIWRNKYGLETELDSSIAQIHTTRRNQRMTSTLTIPDVAVKDGGDYICKTTNIFGSVMRNIHLEIEETIPNIIIIVSIVAGAILVLTVAAVLVAIAKRKGWICKSDLDDSMELPASRPMPPVPKYVYKTDTIDSGVEDLQELQEMYGTLKPRPPPRMEKKWESVGLSYTAWAVSYNEVPEPTTVLLGHTATLRCSFHGMSPEDVVTWNGPPDMTTITSGRRVDPNYPRHKIAGDVQKEEFYLNIQDASVEDGGTYKCKVFGLSPREAKLTVIVPVPQPPTLRGAEVPSKAGQQLEVSCTSSGGHPLPQLTWYNGTEAFTDQYVRRQEKGDRVEADLILRRLTKWDNGMNLTCRARQPFPEITSAQESWKILQVNYPPSISVPTTSVQAKEGDPAILSCLVDSYPFASITWTKHGLAVPNNDMGSGTYRIPHASRQDAGIYQCTADNGVFPKAVGTVSLDVLYPPSIDPSMEKKVTVLQGNDEFSLECLAEGNPEPRVKWWRKDTNLYWENPLRFRLVHYDIEGTYQCVAISNGFPQSTKDIHIDVIGKPHLDGHGNSAMINAAVGETVRLPCAVFADPLPSNVEWIWRNKYGLETELDSTISQIETIRRNQRMTSTLTIPDVAVKDGGDYICKTTNMFGSVMRNIHLEIEETIPNVIVITSIVAGAILVLTVAAVLVAIAKRKGWICKSDLDDSLELPASRPMPPVPKYVYKTGTIDSGVEDLQELQEMYGTLKPRPPPRMEKKWESVGLSYTVNGASYEEVPMPTAVLLGRTTTLHCSFSAMSPEDMVTWLGPPGFRQYLSAREWDKLVGDTEMGEYHLQIQDVTMEDEGIYRCANLDLTPKEAKLTVVVPVSRTPLLRGLEVPSKVGKELELRCLSTGGHPLPELTWYNGTQAFTGEQVRRQEREGQVEVELVIPQLTKWDNGMNLTCRASQPFPEITSVQESWNPPMVSVPITSVSVVEGEAAFLTCLVDGSPPASISWIKLGHPMPLVQDVRKQTLRIRNTTRLDAGIYQCSAENGILPIAVGTVTLNVLYPPVINPSMEKKVTVQQGNDGFLLECLADGNPEPRVRWRRKDTNLYWENPLRFRRVSYEVEGTYQCVATSDGFPLQAKDTFIDVVGKPLMQRKTGTSTVSAAVGEAVRMSCTVTADPLPSKMDWIWRNDDGVEKELPASVNSKIVITEEGQGMTSILTIPDATVQNSGNYICTASNVFGSVRRNIRLDISGFLPMEIIIPSVTAGTILLLTTGAVLVIFAKRRGWICESHIEEPFRVPVSRPMPPVPKYVYKTGTIDSGVEDLQELREMYGTLKPRPPPRMDTGWPSAGLPNGEEWSRRYGSADLDGSPVTVQSVAVGSVASEVYE
ncbi:hypothetical protein Bbelb_002080 [Branchiostoma belcheri]|nr:hypothetical protein Bbelb_002080 [Branchiostoma belcheri]